MNMLGWTSGRNTNLICSSCGKEENTTYYKCTDCNQQYCQSCEESEPHDPDHVLQKYSYDSMGGVFHPNNF